MASAPDDNIYDDFLQRRGHDVEAVGWEQNYNKKQCPDCGGLHEDGASECTVCGWEPAD